VEHTSTLNTVNNLGLLYAYQGKVVEAEMYMRALREKEKAWGVEHTSTLNTVSNLGLLYADQGKMVEAEEMYMRALRGYEKAWGVEHTSTLDTVNSLDVPTSRVRHGVMAVPCRLPSLPRPYL
jgi:tetratricopeptide (TPR) repeat protein